jgi:hypothetical protein
MKTPDSSKIMQIIVFVIIILVVLLFVKLEKRDLTCGDENDPKTCGVGYSMATYSGVPNKKDSVEDTKRKISFLARYEENTIVWRRMALISIIIAFLSSYIITKKFPDWKTVIILMVVIYSVLYISHVIYKPLKEQKAIELIDKNLKNL